MGKAVRLSEPVFHGCPRRSGHVFEAGVRLRGLRPDLLMSSLHHHRAQYFFNADEALGQENEAVFPE